MAGRKRVEKELKTFSPHGVHIATEGPLGWAARSVCKKAGFPFTTSYQTRFPEYIRARIPVPLTISYSVIRRFHKSCVRTMVATAALAEELKARGFGPLVPWSRGVDTELFRPRDTSYLGFTAPVLMYIGRVAVEKNIEAFLRFNLPATKVIFGDGPARQELQKKYPEARFTGYLRGRALAEYAAAADVMVFPRRLSENSNFLSDRGKLEKITGGI